MEQTDKSMIQIPRGIILAMLAVPLLPGFAATINSIDAVGDPRFHEVRGPDILRLIAIGWCAGISFCGLVLLIHSKLRRSEHAPA